MCHLPTLTDSEFLCQDHIIVKNVYFWDGNSTIVTLKTIYTHTVVSVPVNFETEC